MPSTVEITESLIRDYINRAVTDVFKTMLGRVPTFSTPGETTSKAASPHTSGRPLVVGTVGFVGDINGLIYLHLDLAFAELCIIEDKPAIIQQIQEGLRHTPWKIRGVSTTAEAVAQCASATPDLILVSLSLPEEAAFTFFRHIRTGIKTKYTPVFGLVVKTEIAQQQQAQTVGFSAVITKPIDTAELETKVAKAMNLDTSLRYFALDGEAMVLTMPENCAPAVLAEVGAYLKPKFAEAVDAGVNKVVIDLHHVKALHMGIIKLLFQAMQTCRELAISYALVGHAQLVSECKGFEDTRGWTFHDSLEDAKASLARATPQLAGVS